MLSREMIKQFRGHFPVLQDTAYFETAATGLVPDYIYEGVRRYLDDRYLKGGDSVWKCGGREVSTLEMMEHSKKKLSAMIHAKSEKIAFGLSSTQLFTMVTEGIEYEPSENIVTAGDGWIGSRYAWQKREAEGLEVRYAYSKDGVIRNQDIISLCDEHTRAVSVNLVDSQTGSRMDIKKLGSFCRENGIFLFADGVQALGALEVDVEQSGIDFLVGNDYKWMMNFCGTGYAYISRRIQEKIRRWGAGWMSDKNRFDTAKERLELREDAGRFEIGYLNTAGIYGLGLAAEQYLRFGAQEIENYVLSLAGYLENAVERSKAAKMLYRFPEENRSQIVCLQLGEGAADEEAFRKAGVKASVRNDERYGRIMRIGLHYYNDENDIDRLMEGIERGGSYA